MPRVAAFDAKHPLWEEFISLRQQGTYIHQLVRLAHERGFPMSYRQLNRGLQSAKYVKHLPNRSSHWLQNRVADVDAKIDSLDTMHGLAALSSEKLFDIQTALAEPDLTFSRRQFLETKEALERKTLWGFCRDIITIEIEIGIRDKKKPADRSTQGIIPGSLQDQIRSLEAEITNAMSGGKITLREIEIEPGKTVTADIRPLMDPNYHLKQIGFTRAPGEAIIVNGEVLEEPPDDQEQV